MNGMTEVALILGVCFAGEWIAALLPVNFPASVVSMVLLAVLLLCGIIRERQIQTLSKFLIANMGLFFVPAMVGTLEYTDVLKSRLVPFLLITILTTPIVYLAAAWAAQLLMRGKRGGRKDG